MTDPDQPHPFAGGFDRQHVVTANLAPQTYRCPNHGIIEHVIHSNIPGLTGDWCQLCWLEQLDHLGVERVVREPRL